MERMQQWLDFDDPILIAEAQATLQASAAQNSLSVAVELG
jgi:hypothetical protein